MKPIKRAALNWSYIHDFNAQTRGCFRRGILQEKGPKSCPLAILNGMLDILLALASATSPFLTNSKNFAAIQGYLQDLIPKDCRRGRRLMVVNEAYKMKPAIYEDEEGNEYEDYSSFVEHNVDEKRLEELGLKRRLEAVSLQMPAAGTVVSVDCFTTSSLYGPCASES